jgi:hypothetical protein
MNMTLPPLNRAHITPSQQQRQRQQTSRRGWITRALLISLTLSFICIDDDPIGEVSLRRRLEGDGAENETTAVRAALTALEQLEEALGELGEIMSAQDDVSPEDDQSKAMTAAPAQDQVFADQDVSEQQTPDEQHQADVQPVQDQTETTSQSSDESIKKAAAEALGERLPRNHRDELPQPIQTREKYL